jgi:hypothetical protein
VQGQCARLPKHAVTRLPSAGPPEARAPFCAVSDLFDYGLVAVYGLFMGLSPPGRTAGGPQRGFVLQAQAA